MMKEQRMPPQPKIYKIFWKLRENSGSLSKYQEVIKAVNNRFMNNVILKRLKTFKGYKFNISLSFS